VHLHLLRLKGTFLIAFVIKWMEVPEKPPIIAAVNPMIFNVLGGCMILCVALLDWTSLVVPLGCSLFVVCMFNLN
jgi:hypothetical protein